MSAILDFIEAQGGLASLVITVGITALAGLVSEELGKRKRDRGVSCVRKEVES